MRLLGIQNKTTDSVTLSSITFGAFFMIMVVSVLFFFLFVMIVFMGMSFFFPVMIVSRMRMIRGTLLAQTKKEKRKNANKERRVRECECTCEGKAASRRQQAMIRDISVQWMTRWNTKKVDDTTISLKPYVPFHVHGSVRADQRHSWQVDRPPDLWFPIARRLCRSAKQPVADPVTGQESPSHCQG